MQLFRTVVDGYVLKTFSYLRERKEENERKRRVIETLAWFALALLLALVVPNIGVAIALIGGIASSFIFVFPGMYSWLKILSFLAITFNYLAFHLLPLSSSILFNYSYELF